MSDLAGALDAALRERYKVTGFKTPVTQRRGLTARMNALEEQFTRPGDRKGAATKRVAAATGISARTWQKWRDKDSRQSSRLLAKLEAAYQKIIIEPKIRRKVNSQKAPDKVHVKAIVVWNGYKNKKPYRKVKLDGMRNTMIHTIRAWFHEGPEAAAEVFERGTADAHNVPEDPGIQFEGDQVIIEFPGKMTHGQHRQ